MSDYRFLTIDENALEPYANLTANNQTFVLVPVGEMVTPCQHPDSSFYPFAFLPSVGVCKDCGALIQPGNGDDWKIVPPEQFEALLFHAILNPYSLVIEELESIIYETRDAIAMAKAIYHTNPVLLAESNEMIARSKHIWEDLIARMKEESK